MVSLGALRWTTQPYIKLTSCNIYRIAMSDDNAHIANRETHEFNLAYARYRKLIRDERATVEAVYVIEYEPESNVERNFDQKKMSMNERDEIWVFHGTDMASMKKIIIEGFKVGGVDVNIANGALYGEGVYTATGPSTPMSYSPDSNTVILAKALPGRIGGWYDGDCWVPKDDWKVFRTGSPLLPCYIVHYKKRN